MGLIDGEEVAAAGPVVADERVLGADLGQRLPTWTLEAGACRSDLMRARLCTVYWVETWLVAAKVTRMEQSERDDRDDRIQLGMLKRALAVMGRRPRVEVVNIRREERVTMELHRALANRLRTDPKAVLDVVPDNLDRLRAGLRSPIRQKWVDRWAERVDSPVDLLILGMLADTPEGRELRQNSPFAGALTQGERVAAIERVNQE
ncbi:hypothetical protein E3T28_06590 [Cryobacterium sinapicolor]|uniref:Uncharacterized protein n=1 Tax=Cryobacterium sinapicolor TaxID=1259236 RepID=A0ABY2JAP1_9MICO|nr:hypothetical protein [Cryobacterium sinapicolor]TFD01413.1 hypothetical protein E3T28_06590 [Cryobacterium sinapicolor]